MEYGYASSPSSSPNQSLNFAFPYDTNSESSSPRSPPVSSLLTYHGSTRLIFNQMMYNSAPVPYDMLSYGNNAAYYGPQATRIPVEYTGSSTLDDRDRRRRRTSVSTKEKENVPNMHLVSTSNPFSYELELTSEWQRRRAQNRASQRAFRERKEKHVKGLEHQLEDLHDKHQDLLSSYSRQADEVSKLNARIQDLTSELEMIRSSNDMSFSELLTPEKFDAIPGSDMMYSGPEFYFDKGVMDPNSEFSLNQLDDAL
jgi:AP-1-like transcription factor